METTYTVHSVFIISCNLCGSVNSLGLEKMYCASNIVFFYFLETVADVDEVLGEMFLEEIQPTEEQLIVGIN